MPYDYLTRELDKLYEREIPVEDTDAINKQCEFIQVFIEACGWTTQEYVDTMVSIYFDKNN